MILCKNKEIIRNAQIIKKGAPSSGCAFLFRMTVLSGKVSPQWRLNFSSDGPDKGKSKGKGTRCSTALLYAGTAPVSSGYVLGGLVIPEDGL